MEVGTPTPSALPLIFYQTPAGNVPVRDWLRKLDRQDRLPIGQDIERVQYRFPVGMPLCRPMGSGIWEIRTDIAHGNTARVLFMVHDGRIILLHGFVKKTRKTPPADLELARKRQAEVIAWRPTHT